ncbi:MAG: ATP-binding protein [Candidatus Dormibacteraceae bacterium]
MISKIAPQLLKVMLDDLPFGVALHDLQEGFPILYRNRQYAKQVGIELEFARDRRLRELAEGVVKDRQRGHVELSIPGPEATSLVRNWIMVPLLDERGELVGFISVVEDLTAPVLARRHMERAVVQGMDLMLSITQLADEHVSKEDFLSRVIQRLQELFKATRVNFREFDAEQSGLMIKEGDSVAHPLSIMPCDPGASDLFSQVVFTGRVFRGTVDLTSFEFRPYARLIDLSRLADCKVLFVPWRAGAERMGIVVAQRPPEGEDFTNEEAIVLMSAGHITGLVCQRKRVEQTLAERAKELEALEELKSGFLRLAAHELRSPLTLLNGYISMLSDEKLSPDHHPYIRSILQQAVNRMGLIVTQLTDATQLEESRLRLQNRKVDFREIVQGAVDNVMPIWSLERSMDFELVLPEVAVPMVVDVFRIETIVQNLLDNAFKYSTPGDHVRCELRVDPESIRVMVQDQGIGISADEREQLFKRFGRVANARNSHISGVGLGLFISQEMARMHGGEIRICSEEGVGSKFELVLPVTPELNGVDCMGQLESDD